MYEKIAWNNFLKTGSIESFIEYKKLLKTNEEIGIISVPNNVDLNIKKNVGVLINELDKSKRNSN